MRILLKCFVVSYVTVQAYWPTSVYCGESEWVWPGLSERLLYKATEVGDRVPDFSAVGFEFGRSEIPNIAQAVFVEPGPGDDTARIQTAIDRVASLPVGDNGFRGAVVLGAGEFQIATSIDISESGIVLRGAGNHLQQGTVLRATGTDRRPLIHVATGGSPRRISRTTQSVVDKYVPVGATSFRVESANGYSVGDRVIVHRPSTAAWISALGMDQIPPRSDGGTINQWTPGSKDLNSERMITRIEGDRIFLDAPLTNSLDSQYGGGSVYKISFNNRVNHAGIEGIWGVSDFDSTNPFDEEHSWTFIEIGAAEHVFVRDITAQHFAKNAVSIGRYGKNVTVSNGHFIDPVSLITGARRYSFEVDGQLNLVRDSTSDRSRHDFVFNSPSPGPNVFLDSVATNAFSDTGPHQRYSTGGLFDNVTVEGDNINVRNRGSFGTGHGWAGANMVIWNSQADGFIVQNPPTAQNWLIGSVGRVIDDQRFGIQPAGTIDHHGENVQTQSLYKRQLVDATSVAGAEHREYLLGDYDRYQHDGAASIDRAHFPFDLLLSAPWNATAVGGSDFDVLQPDGDQMVPLSFEFEIAPGEQVFHGVVTIALTTMDDDRNDFIWLSDADRDIALSEFSLTSGESDVILLEFVGQDLGLFDDGDLRLIVGDNTMIDWARLDLTVGDRVIGDSNYSGRFDTADLVAVFRAGEFEDDLIGNSTWATGDWNGDGEFNTSDLVLAFQADTFSESDASTAVPESASSLWAVLFGGLAALARLRSLR